MTAADLSAAPAGTDRSSAHRRSGRDRRSVRDWVVDVLLFAVCSLSGLVVVAEFLSTGPAPRPDWLVVVDVVAGVVACLALWGRRRWPVHVGVLTAVLGTVSTFSAVAVAAALFTVAVHRPRKTLAAVTAVNVVSAAVYGWVWPDPTLSYRVSLAFTLLVIAAVTAWGMFVRTRRQLFVSEREQAERAETEQRLLLEQARQHERTRIAREMHDVLAHRISLLSLHAGALEFRPDAPPADVARAAAVIRANAHQALQDLREILGVLRADPQSTVQSRPQPTLADLPALVEESRRAGARVVCDVSGRGLEAAPPATGRAAYRIVQEGLTNAHRHSPGAPVTVRVDGRAGERLSVDVYNAPLGPLALQPDAAAVAVDAGPRILGGTGLVGMQERAELVGGWLQHGRTPDGGFRLHADLPWVAAS